MSGYRSNGLTMKLKLFIGGLLTVSAALAVVAVVAMSNNNMTSYSAASNQKRELDNQETDANQDYESEESGPAPRVAREALTRDSTQNSHLKDMSCFTDVSNYTIPAAHVKGVGSRFHRPDGIETAILNGYKQKWRCNDENEHSHHQNTNTIITAYVDGGMGYDQMEQKLTVPLCGYYQINSQIVFEFKPPTRDDSSFASVYHILKFSRNCTGWPEYGEIAVIGRSIILPKSAVTTHTSDVVRLCSGGKIWIEIPENMNDHVYPRGDPHATFVSASLVSKTSCHWPPTIQMSNTDHSYDDEPMD